MPTRFFRTGAAAVAAIVLIAGVACSGGGSSDRSETSSPTAEAQETATAAPQASAPTATAAGNELSVAELVKLAEPSVVRIATDGGVGSGFVIAEDGYIITNNHVISTGGANILVTMSDGSEYRATVIGTDPRSDLALLKVDATGLKALGLAKLANVVIGQDVVAIGYALDLTGGEGPSFSVTRGIVSQKNRGINESGILGAVQTDAAINHGNSGGPLLSLLGEVVGVNTALAPDRTTGGVAQGIGYAVGSDTVQAVYEELRENGRVSRGYLGIGGFEALRPAQARELGIPEGTGGVYLGPASNIDPGGPAGQAGLQAGDVIIRIGDTTVVTEADLAVALIKNHAGETVELEVYRGGQKVRLTLTLGTPPA